MQDETGQKSEKNHFADGSSFAHYKVVRQIGAGGMGVVYLAEDSKLERRVALKILNEKFSRHEINLTRFVREARAASSLNHPNIITIYDISEENEIHYIVSEFIEGKTLREIIGEANLNLSEILEISIQIAKALAAAHHANLIHRDIKPENIIVRPDGLVKILDFGLAKAISEANSAHFDDEPARRGETARGIVLGTINYMSPEQARGERLDERTDFFSLGIVIYEMIAGKTPFDGDSMPETWAKLLQTEPLPIARNLFAVPEELRRIVSKMLHKKKEERYQTATKLIADLQSAKKILEQNSENKTDVLVRESFHDTNFANAATELFLPPNNLTGNFSPIIGRTREREEIAALLRQENVNLLTLTGIGGVGKTTLSQTVADALLPEFFDGVYFIELASVTDSEAIAATVAQSLGLNETGGKSIVEILKNHLREKRMLLVLDNFEQVIDAAPQVADLLAAAGQLKILVTSRMRLHLSREREFPVQPLNIPAKSLLEAASSANHDFIHELENIEAVKLFVERARKNKPDFALTFDNAARVAEICARLEGLPLAIELAAARVKILSPAAILGKFENRLNLLTGGARDLPARQRTMRGAIEWSFDLLNADEKKLFCRLSVFHGGFTFEAAEYIAAAPLKNDLPLDVLETLSSLVDKSLIASKEQTKGEMRFRMLEVVREYALENFEASGETDSIQRLHAEYFLRLGETAEPHLQGAESVKWIDVLENEHDNLREVLRWSLENDVKIAVRLAAAIRHLWAVHAHLAEGCRWIEAVLERGGDDVPPDLKFKLLTWLGLFTRHRGDYRKAEQIFQKGLAEGRATKNQQQIATFNRCLGAMAFHESDFERARTFLEEGLTISREIKDLKGIAYSLVFLGDVDRLENNLAAARPLFEEALEILTNLGDKQAASVNLCNLGAIAFSENDYETSRRYYAEAFAIGQELSDKQAMSYALDGFAALAVKNSEHKKAARLAGAAENLRESINSEPELAEKKFRADYLAELKQKIDDKEFNEESELGRKLKLEDIYKVGKNSQNYPNQVPFT